MIITVSLNPAVDRVVTLPVFHSRDTNRIHDRVLDPGGKPLVVKPLTLSRAA
jgi:fructose-1-phosphate kinase PfkB-like protein